MGDAGSRAIGLFIALLAMQSGHPLRITSYNVCYTKLLRVDTTESDLWPIPVGVTSASTARPEVTDVSAESVGSGSCVAVSSGVGVTSGVGAGVTVGVGVNVGCKVGVAVGVTVWITAGVAFMSLLVGVESPSVIIV